MYRRSPPSVFWAPTLSLTSTIGRSYSYQYVESYSQFREAAISNDISLLGKAMKANVNVNAFFRAICTYWGKGATALHEASRRGNVDAVRFLIAHGAGFDIHELSSDKCWEPSSNEHFEGDTPLCSAARKAQSEVVRFLLKAGANPMLKRNAQVHDCHIDTIAAFLEHGLDINGRRDRNPYTNDNPHTLIEQAVVIADKRLIQYLLDHGASLKGLLEPAARRHQDTNILGFLLERGARGEDGRALYQATRRNKPALLQLLLGSGANINFTMDRSSSAYRRYCPEGTLLHVSVVWSDSGIVSLLLKAGLKISSRNKSGETPLLKLAYAMTTSVLPYPYRNSLERLLVLRMLLEAGSDVNAATDAGATALLILTRSQRSHPDPFVLQAIEMLWTHCPDTKIRNKAGKCAQDYLPRIT